MQRTGPWSSTDIDRYLTDTRFPLRVACRWSDDFPRIVSLWYQWDGDQLSCVTHRSAKLLQQLAANPKVGFEVATNEAPYYGVRGTAVAQIEPLGDSDLLQKLIERYLGNTRSALAQWLLARQDEEMLIHLRPKTLNSWDYRQRMSR